MGRILSLSPASRRDPLLRGEADEGGYLSGLKTASIQRTGRLSY